MAYATLTYGVLPSRDTFDLAYMAEVGAFETYSFKNNLILGNADLSINDLWDFLNALVPNSKDCTDYWNRLVVDHDVSTRLSMASDILASLKIEWV